MIVYHAYHKDFPAFYIGKTIHALEHRMNQHKNEANRNRSKSRFYRAIRKYGFDSFEWRILEHCDTLDELNNAEVRWIKLVRECGHKLYNIMAGGTGGDCGGSEYWRNNSPSPEMRDKISNSLKKYFKENEHPMKGKTCEGHPHSEETKKKLSVLKMGHKVSDETRDKLRKANIGKELQPHVIQILKKRFAGKNNPSAKPIICLTTGEEFDYAKLAAIKYNIDLSAIIKCCRGKLKTYKKMRFAYIVPNRVAETLV